MNACAIVGSVWPTFSVPGMSFTGTMFRSLNTAVVVANEPMPRVSKNAVTNPIAPWSSVGRSSPPRSTATRYSTRTPARPTNRSVLASMHEIVRVGLRQIDAGAAHLVHRLREQRVHRLGARRIHDAIG